MEFFLLLAVFSLVFSEEEIPADSPIAVCNEPLNRGTAGPDVGYKYYYDKELAMCLRYRHEGSGGGRNSFATESMCNTFCIAADQHSCGANKEPTGSCLEWEGYVCPSGSMCKRGGLGVGMCCEETNEAEWQKEYTPTCGNGYEVVTVDTWWGKDVVRGRRCSDEFCPNGSQCFAGKWLAYCCMVAERQPLSDTPNNEDSPYQ